VTGWQAWCVLFLALVAGCGGQAPEAETPPRAHAAQRIVSLAPNLTEILFALDLGDRVVGITDYCNYPPEAEDKPRVGGFVNPNLEAVVGLEPDLVVATPNVGNRETVLQLQKLGVEFLIVDPDSLEGLWTSIQILGERAGVPERGQALASDLAAQVEDVRAGVADRPAVSALMVFSREPLIVAGPDTFFDELLRVSGGNNLASDTGQQFPQFSLEEVVRRAPAVIIDSAMGDGDGTAFWKRWDTLPAVRDGRICTPPTDLVTRPGPRVAEGVRLLAACLHPDLAAAAR
jgi:iron complex transport system substrate-binding protein